MSQAERARVVQEAWEAYCREEEIWAVLRESYAAQQQKVQEAWVAYQALRHPVEEAK